jgi:hypothetical protein
MPDYVLWVLACDYYIHEENDEDEDKKDATQTGRH